MENNLKLSTNYIIKSLFEQEYYYFTVRELAGLLKVPVEKAYTIVARLEDRGFIKSIEKGKYLLLGFEPVSYTHLRAHETRHDLVCRLLLEKKKKKNNI